MLVALRLRSLEGGHPAALDAPHNPQQRARGHPFMSSGRTETDFWGCGRTHVQLGLSLIHI
eukprot:9693678-Alexandrium_andersonii.AAC.1